MTTHDVVDEKHIKDIAFKLLALGPALPQFLADLEVWQRGAVVAAMHTHVELPPEVVGALIVSPESVVVWTGEPEPDDSALDEAIYATAEALAERGYVVGPSLGAVGMDWPRGSGDYHGGGPLAENATPEEVEARRDGFLAAVHDLQKGGA